MEGRVKLVEGMQVGDYLLKELVDEGATTRTWEAEQVSVKRDVILNSLRSKILSNDDFLNQYIYDIRAKAAVDHPLIRTVVEAVRLEDNCFYASERLAGETLQEYIDKKQTFTAKEIVHILKQIADAYTYIENNGIRTGLLQWHQIYIADGLLTRVENNAIAGDVDTLVHVEDKSLLGNTFKQLLNPKSSGSTRVNSLCDHMLDREREVPITWSQIHTLSNKVEKELREQQSIADSQKVPMDKKIVIRNLFITIGVSVAVLALVGVAAWILWVPKRSHARDLSEFVLIEEVIKVDIGGEEFEVKPFAIDAHEVTIEEYSDFLKDVEKEGVKTFKSRATPRAVRHFYPTGSKESWEVMYEAAQTGHKWNGRIMGVNHPVTDVTYWCADAYKNWMNWRGDLNIDGEFALPTEAQWKAALVDANYKQFTIGEWNAVDKNSNDVTPRGIHGLAGCVSEWSADTELENDGRTRLPLVLGASYSEGTAGAEERQLMPSRAASRSDLGFRLVNNKK